MSTFPDKTGQTSDRSQPELWTGGSSELQRSSWGSWSSFLNLAHSEAHVWLDLGKNDLSPNVCLNWRNYSFISVVSTTFQYHLHGDVKAPALLMEANRWWIFFFFNWFWDILNWFWIVIRENWDSYESIFWHSHNNDPSPDSAASQTPPTLSFLRWRWTTWPTGTWNQLDQFLFFLSRNTVVWS